jgi:hypothetical protein
MAFWMALVTLVANAKARAMDGTHSGGKTGDGRHDTYLHSLPRVVPDPLSWSAKEWAELLGRTPVD